MKSFPGINFSIGLAQTAYANGASTRYIEEEMKVKVKCTKAGVKNLHQTAASFDIGIYAEANGHATILFSEKSKHVLSAMLTRKDIAAHIVIAVEKMIAICNLANPTTGDAMCDLLLVEAILCAKDWTLADWQAIYTPLAYRQMKTKIPDRYAIKTVDADRKVLAPKGLQEDIDKCVSDFQLARAFIRASGTEDIVRVYAEAKTEQEADQLGLKVIDIVKKYFPH